MSEPSFQRLIGEDLAADAREAIEHGLIENVLERNG